LYETTNKMTIAKSLPQNVRIVDGNSVQVYIDEPTGIIYLKDIYGRVEPLSNYLTPNNQILVNLGTGADVFAENVGLPAQLRTLVQGTNITIVENPTEIQISSSGVGSLQNIGTGAEIYVDASGNNPAELRSITQGINVVVTENGNNVEISSPTYYGSFFSTQTQTTIGSEQKIMTFNNTDANATLGFSIVANSQITADNAGIYNLAFSAQVKRRAGGGGAGNIYIWLKKNGSSVADTTTVLTLTNNNDLFVAAWNFFVPLDAGEFVELAWYSTTALIELHYDPIPVVGIPEIPSIIATINKVG